MTATPSPSPTSRKLAVLLAALVAVAGTALASLVGIVARGEGSADLIGLVALLGLVSLVGVAAAAFYDLRRLIDGIAGTAERAQHLAGHDALSGLVNRALFVERLSMELGRADRAGDARVGVIYVDLDKFKEVNDTLGHAAGDGLIRAVSRRLADLIRGADTLARLGGDEFGIVQTGVRSHRDAEALARRIVDAMREPFDLAEGRAFVGASVGIAISEPPAAGATEPAITAQELMRYADIAMYRAKNEGRNRYAFFEQRMDQALKLRKLVEDDLRSAIDEDGLELHYQPQVSADGERIVSVEALVRWPHPKHGMVPPAQFIPIAEERGLIVALGEWVLRRACRDAATFGAISVAVNVSAIQFKHPGFVAQVERVLAETGMDPGRLEVELTEGVVVDDADQAENAIMELRAMGVRLALDDFGTGYSSLIYLRRFAFDKIKIDRSFLESMETMGESAILVHSVVHLGRALGLTVTAEGVETDEQHRFLQAVGCHLLQGYLFSRPVPAEALRAMLAAGGVPARAPTAPAAIEGSAAAPGTIVAAA